MIELIPCGNLTRQFWVIKQDGKLIRPDGHPNAFYKWQDKEAASIYAEELEAEDG